MARYWIADLHLGHEKVAGLRGFGTTQEHDNEILSCMFNTLRRGDQLWVLGDIVGRADQNGYALSVLNNLKFTNGVEIHLIAGNHDSVSSIHRNGYKYQKEWREVFDSIQQYGRFTFDGEQVFMSHYPYARSGDGANREGVRYLEYRLPDTGHPLMHGHTHQSTPHMGANKRDWLAVSERTDYQQFCVSWDAWNRLVSEKDISGWIKKWKEDNE